MKKLSNGLQAFGHSFLEASDGIEALNVYYNNDDIDLIITDLAMLHGSWEDFIRDINALNPKIHFIVISGIVDKERLKSTLDNL